MNLARHALRGISLALFVSILVGCVKEIKRPDETNLHEVVFHAGWDGDTKTVLQEDGRVFWSPGDEISLFVGAGSSGGFKLTSTNMNPASSVDFEGQICGNPSGAKYIAVYPYNENTRIDNDIVHTYIPTTQVAKEASFCDNTLVSVAVSENENLFFENICSGVKFSVINNGINKIEFRTNYPEEPKNMTGWISFNMSTGEIYMDNNLLDDSCSVTLLPPSGEFFEPGKYYYAVVGPGIYETGLKVMYYKDDAVATLYQKDAALFTAGVFKRLYNADEGLKFVKTYNNPAILLQVLPDNIEKKNITEACYHVNSNVTTSTKLEADGNDVYFSLEGTSAHYYTAGDVFDISKVTRKMFSGWTGIKSIDTSNWITSESETMEGMFEGCLSLESINLSCFETSTVRSMRDMFSNCRNIKQLDFSSFRTPMLRDMGNMFLMNGDIQVSNVAGEFCFSSLRSLDLSMFDVAGVENMGCLFTGCNSLETVNLAGWNTKSLEQMYGMFMWCTNLKQLDLTSFTTDKVYNISCLFLNCSSLETVDLSTFNTSNVIDFSRLFCGCEGLREISISGFNFSSAYTASELFSGCKKLKKLDLKDVTLPKDDLIFGSFNGMASASRACAIRCSEASKPIIVEAMCTPSANPDYITWVDETQAIPDLEDVRDNDLYYSSDFSMHSVVSVLQTATKGPGINIAIMGDEYSDRLIADGTYENDMKRAINTIFSHEPMKSYRDYFNVTMIYLVSNNEVAVSSGGDTFLDVYSGIGDSFKTNMASLQAFPYSSSSRIVNIVLCHDPCSFAGSGALGITWQAYSWFEETECDFGEYQQSIMFVPAYDDEAVFNHTITHEFGHAFASLEDEYTEYIAPSEYDLESYYDLVRHVGAAKNVDTISDPENIKWNRFINDDRYKNTGIGVFEGAYLFSTGFYRPDENSLMRHGEEFNAPSREAIYYRIHKLAYGKDWQYDYETFVRQDLKNISPSQNSVEVKYTPYPARVNKKPYFKMEYSVAEDGKKMVTVIRD